ncbi:uncharacterized protein LOC124287182 isoform X3 [Haliotis rubra]|uniref:uncharacterized protein LOC124287182 isoform X3 n=1 Tax=Haliotis rubra TaxID=36100 RepID=UPI001EE58927|nr:uncharacterized protein LOC124287182 isoform X3 [Haliotis rubra]
MTQLCDTWEANKSIFEEKPTMIKTRMDRKLDGKTDINTGSQTEKCQLDSSCTFKEMPKCNSHVWMDDWMERQTMDCAQYHLFTWRLPASLLDGSAITWVECYSPVQPTRDTDIEACFTLICQERNAIL